MKQKKNSQVAKTQAVASAAAAAISLRAALSLSALLRSRRRITTCPETHTTSARETAPRLPTASTQKELGLEITSPAANESAPRLAWSVLCTPLTAPSWPLGTLSCRFWEAKRSKSHRPKRERASEAARRRAPPGPLLPPLPPTAAAAAAEEEEEEEERGGETAAKEESEGGRNAARHPTSMHRNCDPIPSAPAASEPSPERIRGNAAVAAMPAAAPTPRQAASSTSPSPRQLR
jgi:hypothetical protein